MASAFCPGHVTCFFQPDGGEGDYRLRGSRGAGIRISAGAEVSAEERADGRVRVVIGGVDSDAPVTRALLARLAPGRGYDVVVESSVPCGEGFGMSAAGAMALALCLADGGEEATYAAHAADIEGGGGLGDIAGLSGPSDVNIRLAPGIGEGCVAGTDIRFGRLTLAVLGPKINTGALLSRRSVRDSLAAAGREAVDGFIGSEGVRNLFAASNRFSSLTGLESPEVTDAIRRLREAGIMSGMCMLGNSLFIDASEGEVREVLGENVEAYACSSTSERAHITRRG